MDSRLAKLRTLLTTKNLDAIFVSSLPNISHLTKFTGFGTEDRDAFLLITKAHQYIFTHGIYKEAVEKEVTNFQLIPIQREKPLNDSIQALIKQHDIKQLGFDAFDLKVNEYERLTQKIDKHILVSSNVVAELRIFKTADEIKAIHDACKLGDKAYAYITKQLTIGMTEKELALKLEFFIKKKGAVLSFPSVVAFDKNASKPHHMPTEKKLTPQSLVLLDFGVRLHDYCSDMTRTFFFGKASQKQKKVYSAVLQSQQKAVAFLQDRLEKKLLVTGKEVDAVARDYLIEKGFASIPHSLGHGIGLELHELPRLTIFPEDKLENGMVFSIEPGVYLPDTIGVRIEDLFAIQDNKLVQLTNAPKKLIEY